MVKKKEKSYTLTALLIFGIAVAFFIGIGVGYILGVPAGAILIGETAGVFMENSTIIFDLDEEQIVNYSIQYMKQYINLTTEQMESLEEYERAREFDKGLALSRSREDIGMNGTMNFTLGVAE